MILCFYENIMNFLFFNYHILYPHLDHKIAHVIYLVPYCLPKQPLLGSSFHIYIFDYPMKMFVFYYVHKHIFFCLVIKSDWRIILSAAIVLSIYGFDKRSFISSEYPNFSHSLIARS